MKLYAIGDVHGYADLLEQLLDWIRQDSGGDAVVYFVGDLVDRGPDSRGVVEMVKGVLEEMPGSRLHLGNHDDWFLQGAEGRLRGMELGSWLNHNSGGIQTIGSYGYDLNTWYDVEAEFEQRFPGHLDLLRDAYLYSQIGGIVFCHAGIQRGIPMRRQTKQTLTWIRDEFLMSPMRDGRLVVHGHTPTEHGRPEVWAGRVNIDIGSFFSGMLCCMVLAKGKPLRFVRATGDGVEPVEPVLPQRGAEEVVADPFAFAELPEIDYSEDD